MSDTTFIEDLSSITDADFGAVDMPSEDEPYDNPTASRATPPAGRYTLVLPDEIKTRFWPKNDKGPASLELELDPLKVVMEDGSEGPTMRFQRVSTRKIGENNASTATDLLQRQGIRPFPRSGDEWQMALGQLQGATVEGVYCDWEARVKKDRDGDLGAIRKFLKSKGIAVTDAKAKRVLIRRMANFPKQEDGTHQSKLVFEDAPGGPLTLYANLVPTLRGFALTKEEVASRQ